MKTMDVKNNDKKFILLILFLPTKNNGSLHSLIQIKIKIKLALEFMCLLGYATNDYFYY